LILSKRRAQLKHAQSQLVIEAMKYVDAIPDKEERIKLITTLRTVTDGKIYVEVERARLTLALSRIYEADGKLKEASETLQEVAVETFGSMDKREKAEFLLEQVRLCHTQHDFVKMQIIANKVSKKVLDEAGFEDLKLKFYRLLIELHSNSKDAGALRKDFQAIYTIPNVLTDRGLLENTLSSIVVFLALSAYGNEVSDLLHRINADKNLDTLPIFKRLVVFLTTKEIIPWPLPEEPVYQTHPVLAQPFWFALLHKRVVQHNIRVIAGYYSRLRFARFSALLSLPAEAAELFLSETVSEKMVYAKIDRPAGIVSFEKPKLPSEVLAEWSGDISQLLGLVETTCQLINKENMLHKIVA